MSNTIRQLTITHHELPLFSIKQSKKHQQGLNSEWLVAKGSLIGSFYNNVEHEPSDEVVFVGDFSGFFEESRQTLATVEHILYFEGRISSFELIGFNSDWNHSKKNEMDDNIFTGYFKGTITKQMDGTILNHQSYSVEELKKEGILKSKIQGALILPIFTRFTLKDIVSVNLGQANAFVSGDILIDVKITRQMMAWFQSIPNLSLTLALNRQNSIEVPFRKNGSHRDNDCDITYRYNEDSQQLNFVIRKNFEAEIQSSYKQFFVPFNLLYLKIVATFLQLSVPLPEELHNMPLRLPQVSSETAMIPQGESAASQRNEDSMKASKKPRRKKRERTNDPQRTVTIKFMCLDSDDYIQANNPYTTYNQLHGLKAHDKMMNRMTKINFIRPIEVGDFRLSTNSLSLFPYYKEALFNSTRKNSSFYWNLGLEKRNVDLVDPEVRSIEEQYRFRSENSQEQNKKLFQLAEWRNTHIEIPIYKYWGIFIFQLYIPILILSVFSMFIFLQGNGQTNQNGEFGSVFNLRIANATAILLAYAAIIPVFRDTTSKATYFSFFYLIIYLAMIPLILALVSSALNEGVDFEVWEKSYSAFSDPYFIASFVLLGTLLLMVLIVVIVGVYVSKGYQIDGKFYRFAFVKMKQAIEPSGCEKYRINVNRLRGNQYRFSDLSDIEIGFNFPFSLVHSNSQVNHL